MLKGFRRIYHERPEQFVADKLIQILLLVKLFFFALRVFGMNDRI